MPAYTSSLDNTLAFVAYVMLLIYALLFLAFCAFVYNVIKARNTVNDPRELEANVVESESEGVSKS